MTKEFKSGMYRFKQTGTLYFLQKTDSDQVLVWKGPTRTAALKHYCGSRSREQVELAFEAAS